MASKQSDRGGNPRLLFIDAYDSFSNNIISLLRTELSAEIKTIRIDDKRFSYDNDTTRFRTFLKAFDAVVIGPGPGDPRRSEDIGVIESLWRVSAEDDIPVLGICLGFQALVLAYGGTVSRLNQPRHGLVKNLAHSGTLLFTDISEIRATQYHSWHAQIGHKQVTGDTEALWTGTEQAPALVPLAWDISDDQNGPILMAVRHIQRPFWGVQYHPESICTNAAGAQIIQNWWRGAREWATYRQKHHLLSTGRVPTSLVDSPDSGYATENDSRSPSPLRTTQSALPFLSQRGAKGKLVADEECPQRVAWAMLEFPEAVDLIPELMEGIEKHTAQPPIVLESGTKSGKPVRAETGRYSILCLLDSDRQIFEYATDLGKLTIKQCGHEIKETAHFCNANECLDRLKTWTTSRPTTGGPENIPFWGGLVGYISYEAGLETIHVAPEDYAALGPDICFASVRRSVVLDHVDNKIYIQTLQGSANDADGSKFLKLMQSTIENIITGSSSNSTDQQSPLAPPWECPVQRPDKADYCKKVEQCQSYILLGDSYELCLTGRAALDFHETDTHSPPSPLHLYQHLRKTNPAPFGAFLDLTRDLTIISSSPERFLSWTRDGLCEFRPIKGTVQKRPGITRASAEAILKTDKEQAENLMIVDLIRHDLNGVVGLTGGTATVPKLMQVEEYETVYQLVSVIQGQLNSAGGDTVQKDRQHGVDVLKASLPPGSMTGAPKKRSCELLGKIEGRRRGVYSGVLGYFDVGGGGDFSVVIRSIIKDSQGYSISAGGAVTSLSDPLAEWEEMMAKSTSVRI